MHDLCVIISKFKKYIIKHCFFQIANTASLSALSECQLIDLVLVGNPVQTHKARDERMLSRYVRYPYGVVARRQIPTTTTAYYFRSHGWIIIYYNYYLFNVFLTVRRVSVPTWSGCACAVSSSPPSSSAWESITFATWVGRLIDVRYILSVLHLQWTDLQVFSGQVV